MLEVTGLTVYPVKSMRGIPLEQSTLTPLGLLQDRRFMVVRADGRFVTQRDMPLLALIETQLADDCVVLSRPGHGQVRVPFNGAEGQRIRTRVWKDECETIDQGDTVSRWLTAALESADPLHLVAMAPGFTRPQGKAELLGADNPTVFADAAPFLLANEASLDRLNEALTGNGGKAVAMDRFRPNIVVRGLPAFAEHRETTLEGNGFALRLHYPCQRCIVTTIDQSSAIKHPRREPYRALAALNPMPGKKHAPAFGQNATLAHGDGRMIRLGDVLTEQKAAGTTNPSPQRDVHLFKED